MTRRIFMLVLSFLLAVAVIWAGVRSWAGFEFRQANRIAASFAADEAADPTRLQDALVHIDRALLFFNANPDYLDLKGQLLEMLADVSGTPGREYRHLLGEAAGQYRRAIAERPLWPYSWANLLAVKDKLGEIDGEFLRAFEACDETGPWEPRLQLQLLRIGLSRWPMLSPALQDRLHGVVQRAVQRQPREVFFLLRAYNRSDLVCDQDHGQVMITRWCTN